MFLLHTGNVILNYQYDLNFHKYFFKKSFYSECNGDSYSFHIGCCLGTLPKNNLILYMVLSKVRWETLRYLQYKPAPWARNEYNILERKVLFRWKSEKTNKQIYEIKQKIKSPVWDQDVREHMWILQGNFWVMLVSSWNI